MRFSQAVVVDEHFSLQFKKFGQEREWLDVLLLDHVYLSCCTRQSVIILALATLLLAIFALDLSCRPKIGLVCRVLITIDLLMASSPCGQGRFLVRPKGHTGLTVHKPC